MKNILFYIILVYNFVLLGCSEDDALPETGSLVLKFDNVVGTSNLQLNTSDMPYLNEANEAFRVSKLSYYISSIKLKNEDGTIYVDKIENDGSAGYYLIDEAEAASQQVTLSNVPAGNYTEVTFTIGVDANQVNQGAQTGALDPLKGMFWSWNSGYIFLKVEGNAEASTEKDGAFQYHVGGYKEDTSNPNLINNLKTATLSFRGDDAPVSAKQRPQVHVLFDLKKFFDGDNTHVSFTVNASRHSPKACQDIAGNITDAFTVDHIHSH